MPTPARTEPDVAPFQRHDMPGKKCDAQARVDEHRRPGTSEQRHEDDLFSLTSAGARLPIAASALGNTGLGDAEPNSVEPTRPRRILIVDDNVDVADSLGQLLGMMGNDVRTAYDGETGFELAGTFRPAVVLCHIGMPRVSGYDTARSIRAKEWGRDVVLVALTGWSEKDHPEGSVEAVFDHYLVKPVEVAALVKRLGRVGSLPVKTGSSSRSSPAHGSRGKFTSRLLALRPDLGVRVLVVDDNPMNLLVTSALLESRGLMPWVATNGVEALTLVRQVQFDLILMDLEMPILNGFEATAAIRRVERYFSRPTVPIISYSHTTHSPAVLASHLMSGRLAKPCDVQAIEECLVEWCATYVSPRLRRAKFKGRGMRLDAYRLAVLRQALILDSPPERAYDDITRLLANTLEVPIAIVNMLDEERDWFKSSVGIQQSQSPAVTSFCEAFFRTTRNLIVVEDMLLDNQFKAHPLVAGPPFIRFYAAARLVVRGETVGTLCAYDGKPRRLATDQLDQLRTMVSAAVELIAKRGEGLHTWAGAP